jgi:glucose-1-phosphate adenylyltransferase
VLGYNVRIEEGATSEFSVIFNGVNVGRGAVIRGAIVDKYVNIPPGTMIGCDRREDLRRGLTVTDSGITVVPKRHDFSAAR